MIAFGRILTITAIAVAGFLFSEGAFSGGDVPFPLVGEEENVELHEVWENAEGSRRVKMYEASTGASYVVIESLQPRRVEVLRRTLLNSGVGKLGGDVPFPLVGEEDDVELQQIWENVDGTQRVKMYRSAGGENYVLLETAPLKKIEVLRRTR